jgi:hypothetical protein
MIDPDDKREFATIMEATMAVYGREVTKPVMQLYWSALIEYDMPAVRKAFGAWIKNPDAGQFPPKPADIIRMIDGATGDRAMVTWSKVDKAIRMVGHYQSVAFDDPIIHRVIDEMGGWRKLASLPSNKDLEFASLEFIKRYRAYALAGGVTEYPAYLIGESEAVNGKNGHRGHDPVQLIVDQAKAREVARLGSQGPTLRVTQVKNSEELVGQPISALLPKVAATK